MKIYLIRHGQTDWNNKGLIQGHTDNKLNEVGENQAKEISSKLKGIKVDNVICSPLSRAEETLNIIKSKIGIDLENIIMDGIIERDFGELEAMGVEAFYGIKDYSTLKGYEQNNQIEKRVNDSLKTIINNSKEDDNILVCAHSHVIKAFLASNFKDDYDYTIKLSNCCILEIEVSEKVYKNLTFL